MSDSSEKFPLPWWRKERHRAIPAGSLASGHIPGFEGTSAQFAFCDHFLWSLLKDTGRSDISHQPLGTFLIVESLKRILYNWVVQDYEIQTDMVLNSDFDTLGSLLRNFVSQRFNFILFCFEIVILTPTSLSCVKFKWDDACKASSTVHSV